MSPDRYRRVGAYDIMQFLFLGSEVCIACDYLYYCYELCDLKRLHLLALCLFLEGKFDYVGSSHQWWHVIAVIIFVFWHDAGLQLLTYRLSHPCYT